MAPLHPNLELSRPRLMAIVNATPDSFSDGGLLFSNQKMDIDLVAPRIEKLIAEGADILDIGGESTRPGAEPVSLQQELDRVIPIVEWVANHANVAISVDTSSPEVMVEAAAKGAHLINDVRALSRENALATVAKINIPVCLMHMQGSPKTMQNAPSYDNIVAEVSDFLQQGLVSCTQAGIASERIWLDPGFGFGKTLEHNIALLKHLPELSRLGCPLVVGLSRKSMIGHLLGRELTDRLAGSLALGLIALERGAKVLRVHDVAETRDIIDTFIAVQ
ncbi:MAG: dihydropteroate synthase [Pseudomonadota bacterium]